MNQVNMKMILKTAALGTLLFGSAQVFGQTLKDAYSAEESREYSKAKNICNTILAKEPGNAAVYYHLGVIAYNSYQYDSASYFFNKGTQVNVNEPLSYVGLGLMNLHEKANDKAKQNFDKAVALSNSKDGFVLQQICDAIWTEADLKDANYAFDLINKAIALEPKNLYFKLTLGDVYRLQGEGGKGIKEYEKAADADPKFLYARLKKGELYAKVARNTKNYDAAEEVYTGIVKDNPNYPPVYPDLGEMYYEKGNVDKAKEMYQKFLSLVGNSPAEGLRYASFLYVIKDYKGALEQLNKVAPSLPNNTSVLALKAYSEFETGDFASGTQTMEKYLSVAKKETITSTDYLYYGKMLLKSNQDSAGIVNLLKAQAMDSTLTETYDLVAENYAQNRKYAKAAEMLEKKMRVFSKNPDVRDYFKLGYDYLYAHNLAKADTNFAMVIKNYPTYAYGFFYRAETKSYIDSNMKSYAAKPYYEKFLELSKPDAASYKSQIVEASNYMAAYYYNTKEYDKAKQYSMDVKALDPDNKQANQMLEYLSKMKKK